MRLALLPLLAIALFAAGCDTGDDEIRLDAAFYAGTWGLVSVSDGSGDRTGLVTSFLDDLTVTFRSGGTFTLVADFTAFVNQTVRPDETIEGDYQASAETRSLVLLVSGVGAAFQAEAQSESRVALTAPSSIVAALLGDLPFELQGDVTIVVARR